MRKRVIIEILVGLVLIALLGYSLYFRSKPGRPIVKLDDPAVQASIRENTNKLLVIGIDGAAWDVLLETINQGRAPHFETLINKSAHGVLESIPPLISPALWTTMATGVPREVHGIDNFIIKIPHQYSVTQMNSRFREVPALWNILADQGRSVSVINWYSADPHEVVPRGVFVSFGTDKNKVSPSNVWPPEWAERLNKIDLPRNMRLEQQLDGFNDPVLDRAYDQDRFVLASALEVMRELSPDVMMVYFQNVDVVSHGFWKYRYPVGLEYTYDVSEQQQARLGDALLWYYELTDVLVGALLSEAQGYTVMLVSDHGLAATYPPKSIFIRLNHLLERMGYLRYQGSSCEKVLSTMENMGDMQLQPEREMDIFALCRQLETMTAKGADEVALNQWLVEMKRLDRMGSDPEQQDKRFKQMIDLHKTLTEGHAREDINYGMTWMFNIDDFHKDVQGLYLNLKDREPEGKVARAEYESFMKQAVRELSELVTEQGDKVFEWVRINPQKDVIPLGQADRPDILLKFDRSLLGHEKIMRGPADPDPIPMAALRWSYRDVSADHIPEGVIIISGENAPDFKRLDAGLMDVMPTMLWYLGLPIGADMPGEPLVSAFTESVQKMPVRHIDTWSGKVNFSVEGRPQAITEETRNMLEGLGYIQK